MVFFFWVELSIAQENDTRRPVPKISYLRSILQLLADKKRRKLPGGATGTNFQASQLIFDAPVLAVSCMQNGQHHI
jgi:hypothetical protein